MDELKERLISFPKIGLELHPFQEFELIENQFSIRLYGIVIAIGLLLAVMYGLKRSKQFGLKENDILDGVLCIVPFAIICARAYYCIFEWERFAADPVSVLYIWKGGLAIYGGVLGAVIGVLAFCRVKKVSLGAVLDLMLIAFLIGQSIGRWGNFFNREAYGSYCDNLFAMRIPESFLPGTAGASSELLSQISLLKNKALADGYAGMVQVHPTFLYESVWNLAGFVALHFLSKKRQYDGQMALGYVAWYGLGRTFIEGLRMDSLYWGPFRVSQLLAAISCFAAVGVLVFMAFRKHDKNKLFVNVAAARELAAAEEAAAEQDVAEEPAQEE